MPVSRAPLAEIERFGQRMGWGFRWVSSHGTDFNRDFHVSFTADERTSGRADYNFCGYGCGMEVMMHTYRLLDLTPNGRDGDGLDFTMAWVRHHDRYEAAPKAATPAKVVLLRLSLTCPTRAARTGRAARTRPDRIILLHLKRDIASSLQDLLTLMGEARFGR